MQVLPIQMSQQIHTPGRIEVAENSLPSPPYSVNQTEQPPCRDDTSNIANDGSNRVPSGLNNAGESGNDRDSVVSILQSLRSAPISHNAPPLPMLAPGMVMPPRYPPVQQWLSEIVEACIPLEQILSGQCPPDPARLVPAHSRLQATISAMSQQGGFLVDVRGQGHHPDTVMPTYVPMMSVAAPGSGPAQAPAPTPAPVPAPAPASVSVTGTNHANQLKPENQAYGVPIGLLSNVPADYYQALNAERVSEPIHHLNGPRLNEAPGAANGLHPMVPVLPGMRSGGLPIPTGTVLGGQGHTAVSNGTHPSAPTLGASNAPNSVAGGMDVYAPPQMGHHPAMHLFSGFGHQMAQPAVHFGPVAQPLPVHQAVHQSAHQAVESPDISHRRQESRYNRLEEANEGSPSPAASVEQAVPRSQSKAKRQQKKRRAVFEARTVQCQQCGTFETPEWRRGPNGARTLCNACGLYHAKVAKKRGEAEAAKRLRERRKNRSSSPLSTEEHTGGAKESPQASVDSPGMESSTESSTQDTQDTQGIQDTHENAMHHAPANGVDSETENPDCSTHTESEVKMNEVKIEAKVEPEPGRDQDTRSEPGQVTEPGPIYSSDEATKNEEVSPEAVIAAASAP